MVQSNRTFYATLKAKNRASRLEPSEVEAGQRLLRSQDEEAYKVLIAPVIAMVFNEMIAMSEKHQDSVLDQRKTLASSFDATSAPEITVSEYMDRIIKFAPCSAECFLLACVYLDRILDVHCVSLSPINIHRFLVTSVLISAKQLDDSTYNNKYYSHVGGIAVKELNDLESKFLILLRHHLFVKPRVFEAYRDQIERQALEMPVLPLEHSADRRDKLSDELGLSLSAPAQNCRTEARDNTRLLMKRRLRRSRSFDSILTGKFFSWRTRRSCSANNVLLELVV